MSRSASGTYLDHLTINADVCLFCERIDRFCNNDEDKCLIMNSKSYYSYRKRNSRSRRWGLTQFSAEKAFLYANASCRRKWV